jgi:hypothetical protein
MLTETVFDQLKQTLLDDSLILHEIVQDIIWKLLLSVDLDGASLSDDLRNNRI